MDYRCQWCGREKEVSDENLCSYSPKSRHYFNTQPTTLGNDYVFIWLEDSAKAEAQSNKSKRQTEDKGECEMTEVYPYVVYDMWRGSELTYKGYVLSSDSANPIGRCAHYHVDREAAMKCAEKMAKQWHKDQALKTAFKPRPRKQKEKTSE